jgi:hypothetical protein
MEGLKRWTPTGGVIPMLKQYDGAYVLYADAKAAIEKLEQDHLQTIDQRDKAEDSLALAYWMITGKEAVWSNLFGYDEAIANIRTAVSCWERIASERGAEKEER